MKTIIKKAVAVTLAVMMCLSTSACSFSRSIDERWSLTEEDYTKAAFLNSEDEENDGIRTVTLSISGSEFKDDIQKDKVCITALSLTKDEIDSLAKDEESNVDDKEVIINDFTMKQNDNQTIVLSFKAQEFEYSCIYLYYVHKDAVKDDIYAMGADYIDPTLNKLPAAKIVTNHANMQKNPTIELELENAKPESNIKAEDITLNGAFKNMQISSVEVSDNKIKLQTEGIVNFTDAAFGYVDLSDKSNDLGEEIVASAEIKNIDVYVDSSSFKYSDKVLSFDIDVVGKELDLNDSELASLIKLDEFKVDKTEISKDKKSFKLYINVDAKDIDEAVNKLDNKTLSVDSKAVGFDGIDYIMSVSKASFKINIDSIDKPENNSGKYTASAEIYPLSGKLSDIDKSDITFEGDFSGAEVTSIKKGDNGYTFNFTFPCTDSAKTIFSGYAKLADKKLINQWGTYSDSLMSSADYSLESSKASTADKVKDLVNRIKKDYSAVFTAKDVVLKIMDLGKQVYSGNFSDALGTGKSILGMLGIIDTRSGQQKKIDEIKSIVVDTKLLVENVDKKITDLNDKLEKSTAELQIGIDNNTMQTACERWENFISDINKMESSINKYTASYQKNFVDFVMNSDKLDVYFDKDGKMVIYKGEIRGKLMSVDGEEIDKSKTLSFELNRDNLEKSLNALSVHKNKYSNDLVAALKDDLLEMLKTANNANLAATDENAETLLSCIQTKLSLETLSENNFNIDFIEDFKNLCDAISGTKVNSSLNAFFTYMTAVYNFQQEAEQELVDMNNYLTVALFEYGCLASYAGDYHSGISDDDNSISDAWERAMKALKNTGLHEEKDGQKWCYVVGRPISAAATQFVHRYSVSGKTQISKIKAKGVKRTVYYKYNGLNYDYITLEKDSYNDKMLRGAVVSAYRLDIMKHRFDRMNLNMSFKDYLTNSDIFKLDKNVNLVLASRTSAYDFPLDGKTTLTCVGEHYSDYKVNNSYKIGSSDKSYFEIHEKHTATVYNLSTYSYNTKTVYERAHYGQSHIYWVKDEDACFENTSIKDICYAIFMIN